MAGAAPAGRCGRGPGRRQVPACPSGLVPRRRGRSRRGVGGRPPAGRSSAVLGTERREKHHLSRPRSREAAPRAGGPPMSGKGPVVAAIDCGTNSTRLLAADAARPLARLMRITRLGQGVDATGRLDPAAVDRTVAVLREYRAVMDAHHVDRCRMTATSAARDAANRDDFFAAAEAVIGIAPELLSGDEEGRLSFAGATAELDPTAGPYLVCDIGGGSTELVVG